MDIDFNVMRERGFFNDVIKERNDNIKKVSENGGWKVVSSCPICSSTKSHTNRFQKGFSVFKVCEKCDCLYSTKIPSIQNSGEYDIKSVNEIISSRDEKKREYRKKRFASERIKLIEEHLTDSIKDSSLLDVGCNTGFFLEEAKEKFQRVSGYEPNKKMAEYLHDTFNIHTYTDIDKINDKFDVITLFDVIEHVEKPMELLEKCKDLLFDDGFILVFTPQWKSFAFDILDNESNLYYPTDHLFFLSYKTVVKIANELNMKLELYATKGMDMYDVAAYARDVLKVNKKFDNEKLDTVQYSINGAGYANHMRFILRRV